MATPAFPRPFSLDAREAFDDSVAHPAHTGITIQDYFAAKAMQALISCPNWREDAGDEVGMDASDYTAKTAYIIADAMIKARAEA